MNNVHFAIPEIYGDSLSYYDLLSKLVKAMNTVIENYNTIPDQIAEEVKNLDASQLFSAVLNQLIHSIATDNTKSANAVKVYKKHDLLYATFNETVNLYESLIDFTTGTETELIVGTNIREVNISELFIELRKLIDINKNNIEAVTAVANENSTEITSIHNDITAIENKNTEQDNEISTLRTMISTPYNFKGDVASISALPASGAVNDTYYVQDVKYKVTWTGSAWAQSSLSEADYQTELSELKRDLIEDTNKLWVDFPYTKGHYLTKYGNLTTMEVSYVTDYIPVKYGQKIQVSGYAGNDVALYAFYSGTQANTMISIYAPKEYKHYTQIVEVPKGANYILACSFTDTDRFFIRIICGYDDLIEAIEKVNNAELLLDYKPKYGHHLKKPFDFRNKTSVWFGDSITEGVTSPNLEVTNENYPTLFASFVGASTVYNRAVSGACIADSDNQYSILNRILNYNYGAKDFTFVAGGTNDYTNGKQVGTFGDTTADTFYGALHLVCEHLKTNDNFVNSTVIFITPINQNKNRDNPNAIASINAYRNAIYEVVTSYGFNVVDGSQIGFPIERGGFADELCTDGVHPTKKGHEYYARALCGILM